MNAKRIDLEQLVEHNVKLPIQYITEPLRLKLVERTEQHAHDVPFQHLGPVTVANALVVH